MAGAMAVPNDREAALVTFLTTASGMSLFGLSAAFWGLIFGMAAHWVLSVRRPDPVVQATSGQEVAR
jgi:benzoate membrane transport protein